MPLTKIEGGGLLVVLMSGLIADLCTFSLRGLTECSIGLNASKRFLEKNIFLFLRGCS